MCFYAELRQGLPLPVRIDRDDTMQTDIRGIIPCGEGAGYAGGIMSAAVDGIKAAFAALDLM